MGEVDEEAFAETLAPQVRAARGAFFTPNEIVERVLNAVEPLIAEFGAHRALRVIDPACGAGAFLSAVSRRWPAAELYGIDLERQSLETCRQRVPAATLIEANALLTPLVLRDSKKPAPPLDLWLGNPPYNGTSTLLKNPTQWNLARAALPADLTLPRGTSLRDDYVFFLLNASKALEGREGILAFVTSSTLLDAFQHAPVRQALLRRLNLRGVIDLGPGAFRGTRVSTCITLWSTHPGPAHFEYPPPAPLMVSLSNQPSAPDFAIRPTSEEAEALDAQWRADGLELTTLIPLTFSGLKTRFDELLVDDDAAKLQARLEDLASATSVDAFMARHGLTDRAKLEALWPKRTPFEPSTLRRFHHPGGKQAPRWCCLDRALIPRGDHRLRGDYDPHAEPVKLVFNVNELPLAASVLDVPGCVTAYRHSRFAPLFVPEKIFSKGLSVTRSGEPLGPLVPNLRVTVDGPRAVFERIARFINSAPVQQIWAPAFGTRRILPIPFAVIRA